MSERSRKKAVRHGQRSGKGTRTLSSVKCKFLGHNYVREKAVNRTEGTWQRLDRHGNEKPVDGCTIIETCTRCGANQEVSASVATAKMMNIPLRFDEK